MADTYRCRAQVCGVERSPYSTECGWVFRPPFTGVRAGCHRSCIKTWTDPKKAFPTARPVHTVPCMCVPPWPVPWATWHSAELHHATRVASHRVRAQSTQSSPPAADGDWSTRPALWFCSLAEARAPWPCPHHSNMLGARSTLWSVHPACQLLLGKPVVCWVHAKTYACRWLGQSTRPDP